MFPARLYTAKTPPRLRIRSLYAQFPVFALIISPVSIGSMGLPFLSLPELPSRIRNENYEGTAFHFAASWKKTPGRDWVPWCKQEKSAC
jgi:hypothetical protein